MSKFTRYLDEKKSPSTNGDKQSYQTASDTLKLYRNPWKNQAYRISFIIAVLIMIISLIINFVLLVPPKATSKVKQSEVVDRFDADLLNTTTTNVREPAPYDNYKEPLYEVMPICSTTSTFKSWMDYRKITNTTTRQWKLQQVAHTDELGIRMIDDAYIVAMAKQYGPVGTKYLISFSSGSMIYVIIGDVKANTSCTHPDTSMLEFIVDTENMPSNEKRSGNYNSMFTGTITEIRKVNK